jgi:predicted RNA-binding protein with PUA-like domain
MAHWLMKSEPFKYSWDDLIKDGRTHWNGVRNHQAALYLKAMAIGDEVFFYHSNEGLAVVGIARVVKLAYPDPSDRYRTRPGAGQLRDTRGDESRTAS